jgi:hypothetical protein
MAARYWPLAVSIVAAPFAHAQTRRKYKAIGQQLQAHTRSISTRAPVSQRPSICGIRFRIAPDEPEERPARWLSLEHAYAADWMAEVFDCTNRAISREHLDPAKKARCNHAEGHLRNLFPVVVDDPSRTDNLQCRRP